MAWPPTWLSASTTMTDAPASRATTAAGSPVAPEPTTTTSVSRSQFTEFTIFKRPTLMRPGNYQHCRLGVKLLKLRYGGTHARCRPDPSTHPRGKPEDDRRRREQGEPAW